MATNNEENEREIARLLHKHDCGFPGFPGTCHETCDWTYSDWDNPGYEREWYLKKAKNMLEIAGSFEKAKQTLLSVLDIDEW